jgi:hypothetical protein
LQDETNIGIPKQLLILAFPEARRVFTSCLARDSRDLFDDDVRPPHGPVKANFSNPDVKEVFESTFIILLYDTEHLTAANLRKKMLLAICQHAPKKLIVAVRQEITFLNSILTSPLHRQSKSPTLWYHRRWLLSMMEQKFRSFTDPSEILNRQDLVRSEITAVLRAAERHPNNYYAWQHARCLISAESQGEPESVMEPLDKVLRWCFRNPSDTSGWSFLLYLLGRPAVNPKDAAAVLNSVLEFAARMRWEKEALWVFVRAALGPESLVTNEDRAGQVTMVRQRVMDHGKVPLFGQVNPCCLDPTDRYWGSPEL